MGGYRVLVALSLASLVTNPTLALAQSEGGASDEDAAATVHPENMEATQQARRHFIDGANHFRAHRYREAIQSFELAAALVPSADLWFNIARSYEELSEYEAAITHYQRYLRDRVDPPDAEQVQQLIAQLREQAEAARLNAAERPTTGTIRLRANYDGSAVELDGASVAAAPWTAPRDVDAGRHALSVRREGFVPFRSEVSVEPGVTTAAYADLVPETRYRSIQNDPIFAWIIWGTAAASLGVTIGLGVEAVNQQAVSRDRGLELAAYSDVMLGSTIGLGVLGLVIWFVESRSVGTERITVDDTDNSDLRGADASAAE